MRRLSMSASWKRLLRSVNAKNIANNPANADSRRKIIGGGAGPQT